MPLRYEQQCRLMGGHTQGITAINFSPNGKYLASSGMDGQICIWKLATNELLHTLSGSSPVLSLVWIPTGDDSLICGLKDGTVASISMTFVSTTLSPGPKFLMLLLLQAVLSISGFRAHNYPVERLALADAESPIASGAHKQVRVWLRRKDGELSCNS